MYEDAHLEAAYEDRFSGDQDSDHEVDYDPPVCAVCDEEDGEGDDALAEFVTARFPADFETKLAHGQCGRDKGWILA